MPRDELHPSGRVILDIYTAARAYMIGLGNTAGETMSHIFELRPYDASVVIDAEDEKLPDADAFAYLFRSRQAMKVLAMLRYFTHEEIRVEYERSMASKNNASTDRPSCHRELRVSELQLVDGVERLALMLASVHVRAVPADTARRSSIARAVLGKLITHAHEDDAVAENADDFDVERVRRRCLPFSVALHVFRELQVFQDFKTTVILLK